MKTKTLIPFLVITFGLTWGLAAILFLFYDQVVSIFGEISTTNPLYILAVYSPGLAGIALIFGHYGFKGLGSFFQRLAIWRAPLPWWLFLIVGIPVIVYASAALTGTIANPFPFSSWSQVILALAAAVFLGPIEEFGWRGLALPLLQRKFTPFWASLILGCIWGLWHIPSFLIGGAPQSAWSFGPFFLGIVAISFIINAAFNASRGSLLIAVLFHFQLMNPIFPDAQPWDTLLFSIAAAVVVWLNRRQMFEWGAGVTEVLMPDDRNGLFGRSDKVGSLVKPQIVSLVLLTIILTSCGAYGAFNTDQDKAASAAAEIADFDLPAGYTPEFAASLEGYTLVSYNPGDDHSHLYLIQSAKESDGESLTGMLDQMAPGLYDRQTRMAAVETRSIVVRGQEVPLVVSEGVSGEGGSYRQVTLAFQGKGGPALLVLSEPVARWDQETVDALIASIH